jgi:uncharacterized protein YaiL (DUF2058 family)
MGSSSTNAIVGFLTGNPMQMIAAGYQNKQEKTEKKNEANMSAAAAQSALEKKALQDAADKKLRESNAKNATTQYQKPPIYTEPNVSQKSLLGV